MVFLYTVVGGDAGAGITVVGGGGITVVGGGGHAVAVNVVVTIGSACINVTVIAASAVDADSGGVFRLLLLFLSLDC